MESRPLKTPKVAPKLKAELKKKAPSFLQGAIDQVNEVMALDESADPSNFKLRAPDQFMKHIDATFESFFYQRAYTERNFTFYLQVLAA